MKKSISIGIFVVSLAVIVSGHFYYHQKLEAISEETQSGNMLSVEYRENEETESLEQDHEDWSNDPDPGESDENGDSLERDRLDTEEMPVGLADAITNARETGDELKVAVYASDVMLGIEGEGMAWPEKLDEQFSELLHDISYEIAVYSAGELNTVDLIQSSDYNRVIEEDRDLILLESMLWNDNGQVSADQSTEYIDLIKSAFENAGSEVLTVLSPPAYATENYPVQIDTFTDYASESNWMFVNHWSYWPEMSDDEVLSYVNEDSRLMTAQGHEVVADMILSELGMNP